MFLCDNIRVITEAEMKLTRLISLPYKEAHRIRERQKAGTMTEFYDDEQYLCFSEEELKNYKPKKRGRPVKR